MSPPDRRVEELRMCGKPIVCAPEEWPTLRRHLHEAAARDIETQQGIRAQMALMEIARLDKHFREAPKP